MAIVGLLAIVLLMQSQPEPVQPVATIKQMMLDIIHPASNEIFLFVSRGASQAEKDWDRVRRSAIMLPESGNLLMMRGRARDQGDWMKDARLPVDAGTAAYN